MIVCSTFGPEERMREGSTETISLQDKVVVLGFWLGISLTLRIILYSLHWIGSLGALGMTFLIVTIFLKSSYGKKHDKRFKRVLRYWFSRKFQWISIAITIVAIVMMIAIDRGYARYNDNIEASIEPNYQGSFLNEFEFLAAYTDHVSKGMLVWSSWIMIYEDAEYLTFLVLVRKGLIFRELRER